MNSSVWKKIIQSFALLSFFANVGIVIFICILSVKALTRLGEAFTIPWDQFFVLLQMIFVIFVATVAGGLFIICAIISGLTCIKIESAHNSGLVLRSFTLFVFMAPAIFVTYYLGPEVWQMIRN
jgi:hypothetical protein